MPHGVAHTHLDSLAHINYDGVFYNGYKPDADSVMKNGHTRNSIINLKNGIFTRGILVDLPRLKGVPYLEPGTPIYAQDIEAWEKIAGVKVSAGDAVFIRTGRWARRAALGPFDTNRTGKRSGPSASMIPWLRQRDVALLGGDVPPSLAPSDVEGETGAVHDFALVYLGVHIFDNCRPRSAGRSGAGAQAVGVSVDGRAAGDSRRHGVAGESDCDVLTSSTTQVGDASGHLACVTQTGPAGRVGCCREPARRRGKTHLRNVWRLRVEPPPFRKLHAIGPLRCVFRPRSAVASLATARVISRPDQPDRSVSQGSVSMHTPRGVCRRGASPLRVLIARVSLRLSGNSHAVHTLATAHGISRHGQTDPLPHRKTNCRGRASPTANISMASANSLVAAHSFAT